MKTFLLILTLTGLGMSALSDVAFTSYNDMLQQSVEVIDNELIRSENNPDCTYERYQKLKYHFDKVVEHKKHDSIYYYVFECLKNDMSVVRQYVTFNYDGVDELSHELPEGCVPPTTEEPPQNPCQNGFELGEEIIKDVATLVTKKLIDHPQEAIPTEAQEEIPVDKLDELKKLLPELEEELEKVIEEDHASNPENRQKDDEIPNPDGTVTEVYNFPNGDVAKKTEKPDGTTETVLERPDKSTVTQIDSPNDTSEIIERDPEGKVVQIKEIKPVPNQPEMEEVTTLNPLRDPIGEPLIRPKNPRQIPVDVVIPENVQENFNNAATKFADTLEKYVEGRVKCFAENIIDIKENYLTFVCSTTGHKSIRDALQARFGDAVVCGTHVDCDGLQNELLDKMVHNVNSGTSNENLSVQSNAINRDVDPSVLN